LIPGPQEFLAGVAEIAYRFGLSSLPSARALLRCREEALALNDDSGNPAVEAAALFFVFTWDERRLGSSAWRILPIAVVLHYLFDRHLMLRSADDLAELGWLRHAVAEGSADWPAVQAWFLERTRARPGNERR
jgi:hypothetical protein